ncbi:MAG: hypothetical protein QM589_07190 [Thermomicrobiales bacterium]
MVAKTRDDGNETGRGSTRTTLTLDNDVLVLIRRRAEVTGESMGKVASDLIRESPAADYGEEEEPIPGQYYKGILLVPKHGERRTITTEFIRDLMDEFP